MAKVQSSGPLLRDLKLIELGAARTIAERLLAQLEAPTVDAAALERLASLIRYHGEEHTTLVIRTIIESDENELALIEPVISAVSQLMTVRPNWPDKGLAWIEAFDSLPLLQIVETMRSLSLFKESSLATYLTTILHNKLMPVFESPRVPSKPKRSYRRRQAGEPPPKRVRIRKKANAFGPRSPKRSAAL
ncbi:hypothetical protein [Bradyrhizobium sp. STM 3561]|uniref:hypothetical protein n=1 Tax=Bradyrhizobium sp. STM 3561 TaxID=578923 RepID=UPI00388F2F63